MVILGLVLLVLWLIVAVKALFWIGLVLVLVGLCLNARIGSRGSGRYWW
jgi:hypothetical protein